MTPEEQAAYEAQRQAHNAEIARKINALKAEIEKLKAEKSKYERLKQQYEEMKAKIVAAKPILDHARSNNSDSNRAYNTYYDSPNSKNTTNANQNFKLVQQEIETTLQLLKTAEADANKKIVELRQKILTLTQKINVAQQKIVALYNQMY